MDMSKFKKGRFLKCDDVRGGPLRKKIVEVEMGAFEKPDAYFGDGDKLGLSATNVDVLGKAYGWDSEAWIGREVELYLGQGSFGGKPVEMVRLRLLDQPKPAPKPAAAKSGGGGNGGDPIDDIPFLTADGVL